MDTQFCDSARKPLGPISKADNGSTLKIAGKRVQRCSKCKQTGHNNIIKNCPSNVDLTDIFEDDVDEAKDTLELFDIVMDGNTKVHSGGICQCC